MKELTDYNFPQELKTMDFDQMDILAYQIRDFLLEKVSVTGGHLSSNLGVVELTLALHKVFDSPDDKILWDVGHQSYVHKILTGRAAEFDHLRQYGGISGFPRRSESPHDVYDSGHSSDSLSVALGLARARELKKEDFNVVAVIGDGALTGGVSYEALNNAASLRSKMIIIINDNQMSISKNIGGLTQHLRRLRVNPKYIQAKHEIKDSLKDRGNIGRKVYKCLERGRDALKYLMLDKCMFENLGFKFYGPIDGHNVRELTEFLEAVKPLDSPTILHVVTKKGKGFRMIENNPDVYHGIGPFSLATMEPENTDNSKNFSQLFGNKLMEMAKKDNRIIAVSAAMTDGTGLHNMKKLMPDRVLDVGIAEQHAISFASGLALQGLRPFVAIYSTFLQRAYDEILTNICLQNLPVVLCIDRAGNVGEDGATHNGQFDLSYLSHMPNMTIMAPSNGEELGKMLEYALKLGTPCAIRYPRGKVPTDMPEYDVEIDGKMKVLNDGKDAVIFAVGKYVPYALKAAKLLEDKGIGCKVVNSLFIKPLDEKGILDSLKDVRLVVTMEDNAVSGGFGSIINSLLATHHAIDKDIKVVNLGWPDQFIGHAKTSIVEEKFGLDAQSVAERIKMELDSKERV